VERIGGEVGRLDLSLKVRETCRRVLQKHVRNLGRVCEAAHNLAQGALETARVRETARKLWRGARECPGALAGSAEVCKLSGRVRGGSRNLWQGPQVCAEGCVDPLDVAGCQILDKFLIRHLDPEPITSGGNSGLVRTSHQRAFLLRKA